MKMRRKLLLFLALALPACSGGGSSGGGSGFSDFVADQLTRTADDTDAAAINELDFADAASEDEDLFAGLLD